MSSPKGPDRSAHLKIARNLAIQTVKLAAPETSVNELMRIFDLIVRNRENPAFMAKLSKFPNMDVLLSHIVNDGPEATLVDICLTTSEQADMVTFASKFRNRFRRVIGPEDLQSIGITPLQDSSLPAQLPSAPQAEPQGGASAPADVSTDRPPTRAGKVAIPQAPKPPVVDEHLGRHITGMSVVRRAELEDADKEEAKRLADEDKKKAAAAAASSRQAVANPPEERSSFFPKAAKRDTSPRHPKKGGTSARKRAAVVGTTSTPDSHSKATLANPADSHRPTAVGEDSTDSSNHQTRVGADNSAQPEMSDAEFNSLESEDAKRLRSYLRVFFENQNSKLVKLAIERNPNIGVLLRDMNEQAGEKHAYLAIQKYAFWGVGRYCKSLLAGLDAMMENSTEAGPDAILEPPTTAELRILIEKAESELPDTAEPSSHSATSIPTRQADTTMYKLLAKMRADIAREGINIKDGTSRGSKVSLIPAAPRAVAEPEAPSEEAGADDEASFSDVNDEMSFAGVLEGTAPAPATATNAYESLVEPGVPTSTASTAPDTGANSVGDVEPANDIAAHTEELLSMPSPPLSPTPLPPALPIADGNRTQDVNLSELRHPDGTPFVATDADETHTERTSSVWPAPAHYELEVNSVIETGQAIEGVVRPTEENGGKYTVQIMATLVAEVVYGGCEITLEDLSSRLFIKSVAPDADSLSVTINVPQDYDITDKNRFSLPDATHVFNIRRVKKG